MTVPGVGRLIDILKATGRYDSTLIICLSDNGAAFPGAKTTLYDAGMRLPCIIRSPGAARSGTVQDAMITWADIAPTILDVAGISVNGAAFDGRSFRAGLGGEKLSGWDEVYATHNFHGITQFYPIRVVRTRRYKLLVNLESKLTFPLAPDLFYSPTWISALQDPSHRLGRRPLEGFLHRPRFELYDIQRDPDEIVNLAPDPAYAAEMAVLIARLQVWQQATRDPWFYKWTRE